jgi:hypothetical protein
VAVGSVTYRIFGAEFSPYSVKVRSYFRFKQIPHEWLVRNPTNNGEYRKHAKVPLIPLVIPSEGNAFQDSTPIIEKLEVQVPECIRGLWPVCTALRVQPGSHRIGDPEALGA